MALALVHTDPNTGNDHALGTTLGTNFQPQCILYYRFKIYALNKPSPDDWEREFVSGGLYNSIDVAGFADHVLDGTLSDADDDLPDDPIEALSVTVTEQCYVVIYLTSDDPNFRFKEGVPAIKTADVHTTDYRKLMHVDNLGNAHAGTVSGICNLIHFAVKNVRLDGDDHFNIYVQYSSNTNPSFHIIDPAIKNRGGN